VCVSGNLFDNRDRWLRQSLDCPESLLDWDSVHLVSFTRDSWGFPIPKIPAFLSVCTTVFTGYLTVRGSSFSLGHAAANSGEGSHRFKSGCRLLSQLRRGRPIMSKCHSVTAATHRPASRVNQVDLRLPSRVKSVCSSITVEIFWRRRFRYKSFQVDFTRNLPP